MPDSSLKEKTARGLMWGALNNGFNQLLNLVVGIWLLQLLHPADYGMVQVLAVFSSVATALQESGFTQALANKKNPTHDDFNSVFWFNILCSTALYLLLFACAPLIAAFFNKPELTSLARFVFLSFLASGWGLAQRAYLFSHLMVKQSSLIGIIALPIAGATGITLAYMGWAYWALAAQTVVFVCLVTLLSWYFSPWRPTFNWNFKPIREMFGFSSKLLVTNLFMQVNKNVFSFLLGKFYSLETTGYYGNADRWTNMGSTTIDSMIGGVAQPTLTQVKDNSGRYLQVFRKLLRFTAFVSFPAMLGLGLIAPEFIRLAAGEQWMPSVPYLQILCIYGAFFPISSLYSRLIISQGKSGINLYNTISNCICVWILLFSVHSLGILFMVYGFVCLNVLWLGIWQHFAHRLIGFRFTDAARDIFPFLLLAGTAMTIAHYIANPITTLFLRLAIKIVLAALLYLGTLYVCRAKILRESLNFIFKKHQA